MATNKPLNIRTEFEEQIRQIKRSKGKEAWTSWTLDTYLTNVNHLDFITQDEIPPNLTKDEQRLMVWHERKDPNHPLHEHYLSNIKILKDQIKQYESSLCPCKLDTLTQTQKQQISDINDLIVGLTSYGRRDIEDFDPKKDTAIQWSNGFEGWVPLRSWALNPQVKKLDANELIIKNMSDEEIYPLLCCLENLPLFAYSFQAKQDLTPEEREKINEDWAKIMDASLKTDKIKERTK